MMALCAVGEFRRTRLALLPLAALLCGLAGSVLSGSRGGWIGLLLATLALLHYGVAVHGKRLLVGVAIALGLCVLAYFVPATSIARRLADASTDLQQYADGSNVNTHIGVRLELWKASWMMFLDHPWLGVGRDGFEAAIHALAAHGRLQQSLALNYISSHNDMLHMLATGGLLDGALLLALYGAPLQFFHRVVRQPGHPRRAVALAGITLVVCYIGFGLSDVMFWLMLPKVFYAMMVCALAGFCLLPEPSKD
jgi:O-antigen ligase